MAEDQDQDGTSNGLKVLSVQRFEAPAPSNALVDPDNAFATTKEEEWVTKKKVELTTKRQIETRVKRQVVLEDGKVVQDTGPIVTTNTTEDTEKQESSHTEHRQVGDKPGEEDGTGEWVAVPGQDGLIKEVREKNVRSREEKEERVETEDVQHFGDISDDAYQSAIQSLEPDLRLALQRSRGQELKEASSTPRIVHQSCKSKKVVDTEDSQKLSAVQQDGRIITETRKTTEHEEVHNEEEPDDRSSSEEAHEEHKESSEHYTKSKDQELVEYLADGVKIGGEMRYEAENVEGGRRGDPMDSQQWDSLSTRIRKMRKQKLLKTTPDGSILIDRKDALTKKPLDFDQEEETRKVETSKWLEHHFGSESQSSKGSIDDDDIRPSGSSTSFINVTMKSTKNKSTNRVTSPIESNHNSVPKTYNRVANSSSRVFVSSPDSNSNPSPLPQKTSYFQGISEWKSEKENLKHVRSSFSPPIRERVQVLPTGPNHTFNKSPSPSFNQPLSKNLQNGSSGHESPSFHQAERYTYNRYYERNESPSREKNSSPMYPGIRSSPYDRSASPYTSKNVLNGNGKLSSEEEQRSVSPLSRRKKYNSQIEEEEERESSKHFIKRERENWQEPVPDYSPQRETPSPPDIRSTPPPEVTKKKIYQRTRFAADIPPVKPKPQAQQSSGKSGGIGHSFRKLVGRLRSSSSERKKEKKKLQQQQQAERIEHELDGEHSRNHRSDMPLQRYYLGEDPFGGSIYGREKEYRGAQPPPRRPARRGSEHTDESNRNHVTSSSTLGRLSKSTSRLTSERTAPHTINHVIDYTDRGGIQTLPRKLRDGEQRFKKPVNVQPSSMSPQQVWESQRYTKYNSTNHANGSNLNTNGHSNSSSMINVSIVNKSTPPSSSLGMNRSSTSSASPTTGPAKPARTYRSSLLRSKSFNVHAGDDSLRDFNSVYKSNPQLHRLDEDPAPLKSPGIVTSISRSTKDINEAVEDSDKDDLRKTMGGYDTNRFSKSTSHLNGYTNSRISTHETKKKLFMRGLMDRAPELYKTLHGNDTDDSRKSSPIHDELNGKVFASTPVRNGHRVVEYSSSFRSSNTSSPLINGDRVSSPTYTTSITHTPSFRKNNGEITNRSVVRRGSNDDYSETVRITSKSDDPLRPSVTNTVQSFSKKTIPTKGGRAMETIESKETKTITKSSRYRGTEPDLKYLENNNKYSNRNGGVIIEVRNNNK
ncbi:chascon isoform X2 [Lycorma delicatula]|uniref:chascon isoform X2 n=1 Tax=Lycorma delicatula TaxID=130591 RepID=UPI003F513175